MDESKALAEATEKLRVATLALREVAVVSGKLGRKFERRVEEGLLGLELVREALEKVAKREGKSYIKGIKGK